MTMSTKTGLYTTIQTVIHDFQLTLLIAHYPHNKIARYAKGPAQCPSSLTAL